MKEVLKQLYVGRKVYRVTESSSEETGFKTEELEIESVKITSGGLEISFNNVSSKIVIKDIPSEIVTGKPVSSLELSVTR